MTNRASINNGKQPGEIMTPFERGRDQLTQWASSQPQNFFSWDVGFQRSLEYLMGRDRYRGIAGRLYNFGHQLASRADELAIETNLTENHPRLERHDRFGGRIEEVVFHPSHHEIGRIVHASGMLNDYKKPGMNLVSLAKFFLSSLLGEAGHNCAVACTAGAIKVLQAVGTEKLQEKYLARLMSTEYEAHLEGAQFLTEVQGGSDVGINGTRGTPIDLEEGTWVIDGEKWFCSNVSADLSLVSARVAGQGEGTRGLGLFLVPRYVDDKRLNNYRVIRLKEKLGTRSMATGEIEFDQALAYQIGPTESSFKNMMTYVINTSRIYNAVGVCGNARRAYQVAQSYAEYRRAFGQPIIHFPLVQAMLANMRADSSAMLAGTLFLINQMDLLELDETGEDSSDFWRLALNLNKFRSATLAHEVILTGIELLGGNGAVETFSVLPRLLRDNIVFENWEGTHNVLLAQCQRDIRRYHIDRAFFATIRKLADSLRTDDLRSLFLRECESIEQELAHVMAMDELTAGIYFRPLMVRLTDLYYSICLACEGEWELTEKRDRTKLRLAALFFDRRVMSREPKDIAYYDDKVSRLCRP